METINVSMNMEDKEFLESYLELRKLRRKYYTYKGVKYIVTVD